MAIKLFATDVDGTLTDAGMYYSESGEELKKFNTRDGMGLKLIQAEGVKTAIITSEDTQIVSRRAKKLGVDFLFQGKRPKLETISELCQKLGITMGEVAYIGDDINDFDLLCAAGIKACPADAVKKIAEIPNIIRLQKKGGEGAVREFIEIIFEKNLI
ncbi:MAG: HAD-IIIA family hydrolase [Opitutales bacterium]|nr:HAD-IIIA family hydrolase [Opitutales bacterium]